MNACSFRGSTARGFTLVELLVVVTIVAILSAIAVPSYRAYVIRVNRTDAKVALTNTAQFLERCFTRFNVYNRGGADCAHGMPYTTQSGTYTINGELNANSYTLTATPAGGQADDTACANFTLNQAGRQEVSGAKSATPTECWGK
ncbi:MAG: type IV pilin protein [Steroidobacteraceae bacterium]